MSATTVKETGVKTTNDKTPKIMSTQLMLSGHNFIMAEQFANELDENTPANLRVTIDSAKTILVPQSLYEPSMAEGYLSLNDKRVEREECIVTAQKADIVALMVIDQRIARALKNDKWKVTYSSPLLEGVVSYAKCVRINITEQNTYITISDNGKLQYAEAFATTQIDNILFIVENLHEVLSIKGYEVRVSGPDAESVAEAMKGRFKVCKVV